MPTISEDEIAELIETGNGASVVLPDSGAGFLKLSYLWGKLRVDRCDEAGKILAPESRGGGGGSIPTTAP